MVSDSPILRIALITSAMTSASPLGATVHTIRWYPISRDNGNIEIKIGGILPSDTLQAQADFTFLYVYHWWLYSYGSNEPDPWYLWGDDGEAWDRVNLASGETSWKSGVTQYSGYSSGPLLGYSIGARLTKNGDYGILAIQLRTTARDQCNIPPYARMHQVVCAAFYPAVLADIEIFTTSPSSFVEVRTFPWTGPDLPEPASWAMMVVGFGLVGGALRRRARIQVTSG